MSEYDYDYGFDTENGEETEGEFGFDYDSNDVLYHYGDGFATGSDGKQYMEIGGGHVVDLETDEVHYAPTAGSTSYDFTGSAGLWPYAGILCAIVCVVYTTMIFSYGAKYLLHALVTGLGAYVCFAKCRKPR